MFVEPKPCWHELAEPLDAGETQALIDLQHRLRTRRLRGNMREVRAWITQGWLSPRVAENASAVGIFVIGEMLVRRGTASTADAFEPFLSPYGAVMELTARDFLAGEWRWSHVGGSCFLVGPDRVLTAAHCVTASAKMLIARREFHVVFGFQTPPGRDASAPMSRARDVYTVVAIEPGGKYESPGTDWVTLKLDRPAAGADRQPTRIAREPLVFGREVYSLGHPKAIALRYARSLDIWRSAYDGCYEAHLDAYDGVSGAPVFDALTHQVIGMLIRSCPNREGQVLTRQGHYLSPLCFRDDRRCGAVVIAARQFGRAA